MKSLTGSAHSHCGPWTFLFFGAPDEDWDDGGADLQRSNESWIVTEAQVSPEPQQDRRCCRGRRRQADNLAPGATSMPLASFLWLLVFFRFIEMPTANVWMNFSNCGLLPALRLGHCSIGDMKLGQENLRSHLLRVGLVLKIWWGL